MPTQKADGHILLMSFIATTKDAPPNNRHTAEVQL